MKLDWKAVLGIAISVGLLWWLFKDQDLGELWGQIRAANPWLFLASIIVATSAFLIRAIRWGLLLHPVAPNTSLYNRWATTLIGFMSNNVLPARLGEFVRPYALSRVEPVTMSAALGTLVMARILDGVALIALLIVALSLPSFPEGATVLGQPVAVFARGGALIFGGALVFLLVLLLWPGRTMAVAKWTTGVLPAALAERVLSILSSFLDGVSSLRNPVLFAKALALSLVHWAYYGLSFWLALEAFGIKVGYAGALFTQAMVAIGVAVPSAPGFFGTWHTAAQIALVGPYGVPETQALAFATSLHLGGFVPITALGFFYAWKLGISIKAPPKQSEAT